jgi:type VI secretion system protein ImpH
MADTDRAQAGALDLLRELAEAPERFGFYEALRWFDAAYPQNPRTGYALRPRDEMLRIGQKASMAFAPSPLAEFSRHPDGARWRLITYFFGLLGPNGILPLHLTEFAYERVHRHRDKTFVAFLDVFHHRFAELFYRAWADAQPTVQLDRPDNDRFSRYVGSLEGYGEPSLRNRDALPDGVKLHFAGHFSCPNKHPDGLRSIVASYFGVPAEIREFVGNWLRIPDTSLLRLGGDASLGRLGDSALVGARIWDRQQNFRVELGPLTWSEYQRLLPGGESLRRLQAIILNYVGFGLHWDVRLRLRKDQVPRTILGKQGRLGWTTWVLGRPPAEDADDLVLDSEHAQLAPSTSPPLAPVGKPG